MPHHNSTESVMETPQVHQWGAPHHGAEGRSANADEVKVNSQWGSLQNAISDRSTHGQKRKFQHLPFLEVQ
jgi:hypothetical protein